MKHLKWLFIVIGLTLLVHGIYLMFGGTYLRTDKVFVLDFFAGIGVYCIFFIIENRLDKPRNVYQASQRRKQMRDWIIVEACCLLLVFMALFGLK